MPYQDPVPKFASRTIDAAVIEDALSGDDAARVFIAQYGRLSRKSIRALVKPFRPDPFEGRSWHCPWSSEPVLVTRRATSGEFSRGERDRQTYQRWNKILSQFGLGDEQLAAGAEVQHLIVPTGSEQPQRTTDAEAQLSRGHGIRWQTMGALSVELHERDVPEWTADLAKVRRYLLHLYPNSLENGRGPAYAETAKRARRRAARTGYILARYFRELATAGQIAEDAGVPQESVLNAVHKIREHGAAFFNGHGRKCCRRFWERHPEEKENANAA